MISKTHLILRVVQYIRIKDSVEITYDGVSTVRVRIPEDLKSSLCGICGNANGNSNDDWVVGPSTLCMNNWPGATAGSLVSATIRL